MLLQSRGHRVEQEKQVLVHMAEETNVNNRAKQCMIVIHDETCYRGEVYGIF